MWCNMIFCSCNAIGTSASIINGTNALLGQVYPNEVQHNWFGHVIPLAPASCDANDITNGTTALHMSKWWKWGATWFCSCDAIGTSASVIHGTTAFLRSWQLKWDARWLFGHIKQLAPVVLLLSMAPLNSFGKDDQNEGQNDFFWSHDVITASSSINWCQWHHQWYCCIP